VNVGELKGTMLVYVTCYFAWQVDNIWQCLCGRILFQVYLDSAEGQRYAAFYSVSDWPYVAVIDPRTGESLRVWNKIDGSSFCDSLLEFLCQQQSLQTPQKRAKLSNSPLAAEVCVFISTWDFALILGLLYNDAVSCWGFITVVIDGWLIEWVWSTGGMKLTEVNWSTRR